VTWKGHLKLVSGTSTSVPTFAAFVALLNDARLAAGLSSLGFLNPMLYALGGVGLHDITVGNAPGCGTPGFNVSASWFIGIWCTYCSEHAWSGDDGVGSRHGFGDT
jgi:tripeptidyl-peptidase-1